MFRNAHLWLGSIIAVMWMIILIAAMFRAESLFSHDKSLMDGIWKVCPPKVKISGVCRNPRNKTLSESSETT